LKVAKAAHVIAKAEVKRLGGIKKTQTTKRNTTRDAHALAKKTHKNSNAILTTKKAAYTTAAAVVKATEAKLVKDQAAAAKAKKLSAAQKAVVEANKNKMDSAHGIWLAAKKTLKATQVKLAAA